MSNHYSPCEGRTLLAVDDEPFNRNYIVELVRANIPTMQVFVAVDGLQALEILKKKQVDIVLLDWEMPKMTGIELLAAMQQNELLKSIPTIMYTGAMTTSDYLSQALGLGAWDFLRKPTDPTELLARLSAVLRQKAAEEARKSAELALITAKNEYLSKEIAQTRQELTDNLLLLTTKNAFLTEIRDYCDLAKATLPQVSQKISRNLAQEDYWDDFLRKFNRIDPNFMQSMTAKFADLSPAELRMAALIRFGVGAKNAALLLNISEDGIKKSRYRLRKRLELASDDNLDIYLQTL
jgi:DNA-binding response OmpR family regulator/DNA-binding CsgD family transcriptional regulator